MSTQAMLTYRGTVYPWHGDHVGHMNVMWYVGKFDEATWHFFHVLGITPTFLRESQRGMAAVEQHLSYMSELHAGDIVSVHSHLVEIREKSIRFGHEMRNEETGAIAARSTIKAVHMDTRVRKSCAFPEGVLAAARALLDAPPR
ncbi:MAG TPA: acyl-CoA thioesterase [Usitatibacteraceae bacterium]|nr:acyl-CoA thioesterase [Usitatibacteraceae bacterium]